MFLFFKLYCNFLFVKNRTKFSQEYYNLIDQYKHAHKNGIKKNNQALPKDITFDGKSLRPWIKHIRDLINLTDSKSILDYGCGKAKFYNNKININNILYKNLGEYWKIDEIKLFDPGVQEYETYPDKNYDGVICTDVLEHINLIDLKNVVEDIFKFSNKFIFFVISTILDQKLLSDGRNVHQTVKDEKWWKNFFSPIIDEFKHINCIVVLTDVDGRNSNKIKRII